MVPINYNFKNVSYQRPQDTVIKHRELLTTVQGGEFSLGTYKIQPGLALSFPWLSGLAPAFEMYKIVSLKYEYISRCPTTYTGLIYMTIDYDAADVPIPSSEAQISQYQGCLTQKVFQNASLTLEKRRLRRDDKLLVREGPIQQGTAIQDYDAGSFIYVAAGTPNEIVGSIYIEYTIQLITPQYYQQQTVGLDQQLIGTYATNPNNIWDSFFQEANLPYFSVKTSADFIMDKANRAYQFIGTKPGRYLVNLFLELAGDISSANVNTVAAEFGNSKDINNILIKNFSTNNTVQGLQIDPQGGGSSSWVLEAVGVLVIIAVEIGSIYRFALMPDVHATIPGNKILASKLALSKLVD